MPTPSAAPHERATAKRTRTSLIVLGVTLPILAGIIAIGALTERDHGGNPNDSQAAAVDPVATPSTSPANSTPAEDPASAEPIDNIPTPTTTATSAPADDGLDPRFATCKKANDAGYGPYHQGDDPEYTWYRDRDKDGTVCEK
jgi:hypothetical protein